MAAKAPSLRSAKLKEWKIPGFDEPFAQDPLTFFEKNEFLALVARALEDGLAGGADLDALLAIIGMDEKQLKKIMSGTMTANDLGFLAGSLFNVITRLIRSGPELMEDLYLIALSVPPNKRESVRENLRLIDDDTGFGILEAFVEQNTTTIRDFFPRWRALLTTTMEKLRVEFLTDLDRLEEYSATHSETFDELGEWPADRFESAWDSYQVRRALDAVDRWERGMKEALYANGMIGGEDLNKELDGIRDHANSLRARLLSTDPSIEAEFDDFDAPYPATAEAEPVGT